MANIFNAEQARKNAEKIKINYEDMLSKILQGTETLSIAGRRSGLFLFPVRATAPDHIVAVEEELRDRGFKVNTTIDEVRDSVNIEVGF